MIPDQLKDERFGFAKVKYATKNPFEKEWQKHPYSCNQIEQWIKTSCNYGVIGGYGDLIVIDADHPDSTQAVEKNLPPTFTVKTPGKGFHFYYLCNDIKKKVVLETCKEKSKIHYGEIISFGSQVIGPGSIHPETKTKYEVYKDLPVAECNGNKILDTLRSFSDKDIVVDNFGEEEINHAKFEAPVDYQYDNLNIDIMQVINTFGLQTKKEGNRLVCAHPIHGSKNGGNLVIDPTGNRWHCFRCQSGGGPLYLIAVLEKIIECSEAKPKKLRNKLFKDTVKIAREKYGIDVSIKRKNSGNMQKLLDQISQNSVLNKNLVQSDLEGFFNDDWNARLFVKQHGQYIKNCDDLGGWHIWNGNVWELDQTYKIIRLSRETVDSFYNLLDGFDEDTQTIFQKHIRQSGNEAKLNAMTNVARSYENVSVKSSQFDSEPYLLNCQNGVVNLKTGELTPHSSSMLITKLCATYYDPSAQCPNWLEFINIIFKGDKEVISFIQKAIGYALTGDVSYQMFFILYGKGSNGKSTLVHTIEKMLGSYATSTPTATLISKQDNEIPNDVARLKGARFISASETGQAKILDEQLIKQLTSTEPIVARFLHREFFEFEPTGKIFLSTNCKPTIRGTDDGIWRRIKLIPFEHQFEGKNKIEDYKETYLYPEFPGILAWAVDGYSKLLEEGFDEPDAVKKATSQYKVSEDVIGSFLNEFCVLQPNCKASASELYDFFCKNSDARTRKKEFNDYLFHKGFTRLKGTSGNLKGKYFWQGIGLKDLINSNEENNE